MCVAAIAWHAHPRWRLVIAGNRDEYHARPAAPLATWNNGIVAGRDLKSGGTWLGASGATGRCVLVTNRRGFGLADPDKASRGTLVTDLLTGAAEAESTPLARYNPFNLIVADTAAATFLTNRPDEVRTTLAHGIYGLSNGALDEPWAKTLRLKAALLEWLNAGVDDPEALFAALRDETLPVAGLHPTQPSDVPREAPDTGVFIRDPVYGTRCSTVLVVDVAGNGTMIERRFDAAGAEAGATTVPLRMSPDG
jgi:uncharacterized protein with NRDE domain